MAVEGQTATRLHLMDSESVTWEQIGAAYTDPNDPTKQVRDVKAHAPASVRVESGAGPIAITIADCGRLLMLTNAGDVAVSLPDPATIVTFFRLPVQYTGSTRARLTPAAGTINGAAYLDVTGDATIFTDGANYSAQKGGAGASLPSDSGNKVLATPADGSAGTAALRALVAADIPAGVGGTRSWLTFSSAAALSPAGNFGGFKADQSVTLGSSGPHLELHGSLKKQATNYMTGFALCKAATSQAYFAIWQGDGNLVIYRYNSGQASLAALGSLSNWAGWALHGLRIIAGSSSGVNMDYEVMGRGTVGAGDSSGSVLNLTSGTWDIWVVDFIDTTHFGSSSDIGKIEMLVA